jgi:hypothetical protein
MLRGHSRFGEFHRVIWREVVGAGKNPRGDTRCSRACARVARYRPYGAWLLLAVYSGLTPGANLCRPCGTGFDPTFVDRHIQASGIHTLGSFIHRVFTHRGLSLHRGHSIGSHCIGSIQALRAFTHWEHSCIGGIQALRAFRHCEHSCIGGIQSG